MFSLNLGAQAVSFAAYGQGTGPILLDDVRCAGTETRLIECPASPITTHNCVHFEDASVRCQPPPSTSLLFDVTNRIEVIFSIMQETAHLEK